MTWGTDSGRPTVQRRAAAPSASPGVDGQDALLQTRQSQATINVPSELVDPHALVRAAAARLRKRDGWDHPAGELTGEKQQWIAWAQAKADWVDPLVAGQRSHPGYAGIAATKLLAVLIDVCRKRRLPPYSHSIVNEPSKVLIRKHHETTPQKFTVIYTINVRSISIGAGLQAIRRMVTFRDLSTSIGSRDHRGHHRRTSGSVDASAHESQHRTPYAIDAIHFFARNLTVRVRHERCLRLDGLPASNPLRPIIDPGCAR